MAAVQFRDLNISFNPHPVTGKVAPLKDEAAVKRALRNLILTNHYERPYNHLVGGNIASKLFENMDNITAMEVKKDIEQAIRNYEPRVELYNVFVDADEEANGLNVTIVFRLVNQTQPIETNIFLERVR